MYTFCSVSIVYVFQYVFLHVTYGLLYKLYRHLAHLLVSSIIVDSFLMFLFMLAQICLKTLLSIF